MPTESSIYWSSADSPRSTSDGFRSSVGGRHYVDPWDLENYAYLRRHSIVDVPRRTRRASAYERSFHDARTYSEYWYTLSSMREPEYNGSPYTQKLYCESIGPTNNSCCYQQAIYEDERMEYAASFPVYAPIPEISRFPPQEERSLLRAAHTDENKYIVEAMPPPLSHSRHLNTCGHLKIDYTNSWNSLNRRISK